jgi:RNA polymerase sigma-70 factor (ECF subfamily)
MSGYVFAGELVSREVYAARVALTEGLTMLRASLYEMVSLGVRGDDGIKRTSGRPHTDESTTRHVPGTTARPASGRVFAPRRPPVPVQPGPAEPGPAGWPGAVAPVQPDEARDGRSQVPDGEMGPLAALPADAPISGGTGSAPTGHPDRPDPSGAAAEVRALVERAQAGEAEAFGLIYDRYVDTVFRFVYFRVGNRQLAEDLTSDTFLRALRRIGSFTWQGRDLGAWLVTIARNLVADHFKSGRYRLEITSGDVLDADREDRGLEGSPEGAVVDHITNVALLSAVKRLNPEQQECIVLRFLQGFSVAETAQAMGKNEGAIKALQYRAVRTLARLLPDGLQL